LAVKVNRKAELEKFLKAPRNRAPLRRCETCKLDSETLDAIKDFKEATDCEQTATDFHGFLVEVYDYPMGPTALYNHMKNCLKVNTRR
jgi:hypothetical protein